MKATALAVLAAATLVVGGCAQPEVTATDGGTVAPATATGTTGPTTGSASSGKAGGTDSAGTTPGTTSQQPSTVASQPVSPAPFPTSYVAVAKTITDSGLGHKIVVSRLLRALPWPAGFQASSAAYELVAVELTLTPSTTYVAPLRVKDLSITTGSPYPNRPDTIDNAMLTAAKLPLLPAEVATGSSAKGWVVFRIDPKAAPKLTLTYTRPKSQVTDTGQVFDSQVFTTDIAG